MLTNIIRVGRECLRSEAQVLTALQAASKCGWDVEIDDFDDGSGGRMSESWRFDNSA